MGRWQVVTALSIHHDGFVVVAYSPTFRYGVGVLKDLTTLTVPGACLEEIIVIITMQVGICQ